MSEGCLRPGVWRPSRAELVDPAFRTDQEPQPVLEHLLVFLREGFHVAERFLPTIVVKIRLKVGDSLADYYLGKGHIENVIKRVFFECTPRLELVAGTIARNRDRTIANHECQVSQRLLEGQSEFRHD